MMWNRRKPMSVGPAGFIATDGGWFLLAKATKLPTPGAMQYGLDHNLQAGRPIVGPAMGIIRQYAAFAIGMQTSQQAAAVPITGSGGLFQGQIIGQPLSNPYV